jgi:hypothetical protein
MKHGIKPVNAHSRRRVPVFRGNLHFTKVDLQSAINASFAFERFWSEYLRIYNDLFSSRESAERKAKTHSIMATCMRLRYEHGCSYYTIYQALKRELSEMNFQICKQLLRLETKEHFVESLFELRSKEE